MKQSYVVNELREDLNTIFQEFQSELVSAVDIVQKMKNFFFDKNSSFFKSSKKYWCFYKRFVKTKQASTTNTMSCNEFAIGNERTTDTCTIANAFSCHFASLKPPSEPSKTDCALRIFERKKNPTKTLASVRQSAIQV